MKKLFRLMLLLSITALIFSLSAMAADIVSEGECGDNLTWTLDAEGLLTVSGNGKMDTYTFYPEVPYYSNMQDIKTVIIENGVTSIGNWAFATCGSLTEIVISQSVTSIGDYAFSDCSNLTSAIFKGAVPTEFGESVFSNVADDFKIFYYNGNSGWNDFNSDYPIVQIDENTSSVPSVIASGTCGDNITWTLFSDGLLELSGSGDMWNYTDDDETPSPFIDHRETIKTISIADGITSIGSTAFVDCDNLTEVEFPASVTTIGSRSFQKCDSLTAIALNNGLTHLKDHAFEFCKNLAAVSLPDTLKYIGEKAFADCEALTAIALPASLEEIGANPFCLCKSLATITVASDNLYFTADNNVLYNKDQTTLYVDPNVVVNKIDHYTVPDGVVRIADRAYSNCQSLVSVTFPASLTTVGDRAFQNCENLSTIAFSDGLKTIEGWAFEYCHSFTDITLPEGLETIGSRAFQCCTGMTNITFPKTLANIGDNVFDECPQLVSATFEGNVPGTWSDDVFGTVNVNSDLIICYYDGYTNWTTPTWTAPDTNKTVYNTFKLSEGNPPAEPGSYTVSLSAPNDVTVGSTFTVAATANQVFSAAELTLVYDETALTFVGVSPSLTGHAANENGTVTLIDFGSTKTGYVFTFTANTVGETEIRLTSAKFSTADDAANSDLKDAVITNNTVTVTVKTPVLNVHLGEYLSGEQTVENGSNYTFYLTGDTEYYNYAITATMGGENVSIIDHGNNTYTIENVTADLVIIATRTAKTYSITMIDTDGAELVSGTISYGSPFALDIPQETDYTVSVESVTYDVGGASVPYIYENDVITIDKTYITGNITITIKKTLILNAECQEYLTLDGTALWLVTNKTSEVTGKTYTYNGTAMYWSDKYEAYCTLVVSEEQPNIDTECFALINESAVSVDYGMDVNKSGKVDANDAQLAYNMYRPMYSGISSDITVEKYLRADVNGDKTINTMDAAAIVNYILNIN